MQRHKLILVALASLLAAACGGSSYPSAHAPVSEGARNASASPVAAESSAPGAPMAADQDVAESAPSAAGGAFRSAGADRGAMKRSEPSPDERPGLGTTFGETRESHVSTAPFFREDPDSPLAVASLFYNDARGARAMARRSGFVERGTGAVSVLNGALSVRLLDASGRPLRGLEGAGRTYAIGEAGQRYIIEIRNHTRNRVEAVATVDGLDVIDGRAGSFSKRGYIVAPFATVDIDGFRRSEDTVAAFRFGSVRGSYAARKGNDRNVGVVGIAFFEEQNSRFPWTGEEIDRRHSADPFPGRFSTPPPNRF